MLHGIHVGDDPYVGKKISSTDACMLGKFVEGRLLAEHVHHVVQHFMMWYNTLTTSFTIPFSLWLKSTLQQLLMHGGKSNVETALNYVSSSGLAGNGFGTTREMSLRKLIRVVTHTHSSREVHFWGDVVEIDTWLDAAGKNGVRRDWIIRDCNTQKIITRATGTWVIMNSETRRLCKIPEQVREEIQPFYLNRLAMAAAQTTMKKLKSSLMKLHAGRIQSGLAPRWSDMDANFHAINVGSAGVLGKHESEVHNGLNLRLRASHVAASIPPDPPSLPL
ncbi:Palmitoyl-acyl carrier protein thioesterase, chloroplastic [Vitis vinifera]|uniref:Acyl-[acyl-carrier-protein] hydrolase n=1 Tax=Vitis vinifera TaxID=29760 RepID=A0A438KAD2_VITVI|nr:Palmitoyl-acyl carrier protein thioesterase, chloroplastic [Vitis vinifera]